MCVCLCEDEATRQAWEVARIGHGTILQITQFHCIDLYTVTVSLYSYLSPIPSLWCRLCYRPSPDLSYTLTLLYTLTMLRR